MSTTAGKKQSQGFSRILLFKDHERITAINHDHKELAKKLTESLRVAMEFVGVELDDHGKEELLTGGFTKAMEIIRKEFQFPKADDAFNLQAIGKDPGPTKIALKNTPAWFVKPRFKVEEGLVVYTDQGKSQTVEVCSSFTQHEKQNEVHALALSLCEKLNDSVEAGYISRSDLGDIERSVKLVKWRDQEAKFSPNPSYLIRINEGGDIASMF